MFFVRSDISENLQHNLVVRNQHVFSGQFFLVNDCLISCLKLVRNPLNYCVLGTSTAAIFF